MDKYYKKKIDIKDPLRYFKNINIANYLMILCFE
jgi:hypothetical protein